MRFRGLVVFLVCVSCKPDERPVCADLDDAACETTDGCHLGLAQPTFDDAASGFACWDLERVVAACVPDLPADRCPYELVKAAPPGGAPCLLFDSTCTPEGWGVCTDPPEVATCPQCANDALPRFVAADVSAGGAAGFGRFVTAGDVDGDGTGDVVVGADDGLVVLIGPISETSVRFRVSTGDPSTDEELVAGVGDVTGDGLPDLVVGGPSAQRDADTTRAGGVWVVEGPLTGDVDLADAITRIEGLSVGDELGAGLQVADLDGDGTDDIVAWARRADGAEPGGGALEVWYGPVAAGVSRADSSDATLGGRSGFGGVSLVGERDGEPVLWVVTGIGQVGVVSLPVSGEVSVDTLPFWTLSNGDITPAPVIALAAGDVDGDGRTDLVWTSGVTVGGLGDSGGVRVSAGPAPVSGTPWATTSTLAGRCSGDQLGVPLAVHDLDSDGADDVLAGATGYGAVAGLVLPGPITSGDTLATDGGVRFGAGQWTAVAVDDLDHDGAPDLIVTDRPSTTVRVWWGAGAR